MTAPRAEAADDPRIDMAKLPHASLLECAYMLYEQLTAEQIKASEYWLAMPRGIREEAAARARRRMEKHYAALRAAGAGPSR